MMFSDTYSSKPLFPYALGCCMVFPKGFEKNRDIGKGSLIVEEEYVIYFKENTPENIKLRFIKDYAEHYKKQKDSGVYCD